MEIVRTYRCCARRMFAFAFVLVLASLNGVRIHADEPDADRYQAYDLKYKSAGEAEALLAEMLDGVGETTHIIADEKSNRILVSGSEKAQRVAAKVLKQIDLPPSLEKSTAKESTVKSYPCPKSKMNGVVEKLKDRYSEMNGVRIAGYTSGERLLILAPAEIHVEIQEFFGGNEKIVERAHEQAPRTNAKPREINAARPKPAAEQVARKAKPARRTERPDRKSDDSVDDNDERFIELSNIRVDALAPYLRKLLSTQLEPVGAGKFEYRLTSARGTSLDVRFDQKRNGIRLEGDPELIVQMASVIQSLDDPSGSGVEKIKVLPLGGIDSQKILEIRSAIQLDTRGAAPAKAKASRPDKRHSEVTRADYVGDPNELSTIQLVKNQDAGNAANAAEPDGQPGPDMDYGAGDESGELERQMRRIGSDLEVEVLPDLDVIILRGKKNDVQEMTRLLKELERLSEQTEPKIEIYHLKHVRGESLAVLIDKVNNDFTGGIRGKVTIAPLVKPNALLLIGWGETVTSVLELIEKLDQPVPPDVQFQIFRLKHADVTQARTTVTEFFTSRAAPATGAAATTGPGLSPRIQVTIDTRTNSLIVQAPPRDMQEVAELIKQLDVPGGEVVHQAKIIKLKNTLAQDIATVLQNAIDATQGKQGGAANQQKSSMLEFLSVDTDGQKILKSGVLDDVKITADVRTNSLIVSASPESMELVEALIRRLDDSPPEGAQIKVFRIVNGDATSLTQMLRSLLPPAGPGGAPQLANSRDDTSLVPTRFSVDLRTNSIIATGSSGDLRIIEALLLRLDQKDVEQRINKVYRLKNAYADAVSKSVNEFLRTEKIVQQAAPGQISPFAQIESEVVVVPEAVSNSLIISATPRYFDDIEKLVEKLDAQPPSVMIQVLIAQVSLNNTNEFGVELGLQDSLLFDRSLLSNLVTNTNTTQTATPSGIITNTLNNIVGANNTPGFAFNGAPLGNSGSPASLATASNVAGQAVSNFGVGIQNQGLGYGGLVLSASSENVSVLIRALQQSNRLEVLSRPQIRTLDNQPAFIQIGQKVPQLTNIAVTVAGSNSGVTLQNIGLILGVTPRISPDGMVVMEVDAENSSIDTVNPGIPVSVSTNGTIIRSPIFNVTTAQTTVSAQSGETIIIGGLITKNSNDTTRRIPFLSDVPIVGNFFRYDSSVNLRSELLIILTPHVIRSPEDAARIKREEVARMHWCAGDVVDVYGPGVIGDDPTPFTESTVPVIYPDLNPRGTIDPMVVPPEPLPPVPAKLMSGKANDSEKKKKKSTALFPSLSKKRD